MKNLAIEATYCVGENNLAEAISELLNSDGKIISILFTGLIPLKKQALDAANRSSIEMIRTYTLIGMVPETEDGRN